MRQTHILLTEDWRPAASAGDIGSYISTAIPTPTYAST